jgi:hypothetical protein
VNPVIFFSWLLIIPDQFTDIGSGKQEKKWAGNLMEVVVGGETVEG